MRLSAPLIMPSISIFDELSSARRFAKISKSYDCMSDKSTNAISFPAKSSSRMHSTIYLKRALCSNYCLPEDLVGLATTSMPEERRSVQPAWKPFSSFYPIVDY